MDERCKLSNESFLILIAIIITIRTIIIIIIITIRAIIIMIIIITIITSDKYICVMSCNVLSGQNWRDINSHQT